MSVVERMTPEQKAIYEKYKAIFPFPLVSFANELGLDIFAVSDFPKNKSGAIRKEDDGKYVIYINDSHSPKRKRFTLAHEIAHYINDKDYLDHNEIIDDTSKQSKSGFLFRPDQPSPDPEMRKMDIAANKFAAELLMPEDEFVKIWHECSTPEAVAEHFNVSVDAALIRASQIIGEIV